MLVVTILAGRTNGQELARQIEALSAQKQARVTSYLNRHPNLSLLEAGRLLVDVSPFGTPVYKKSHSNRQAAFTVSADFLKEGGASFNELEGEGMLIGVWEADVPNSSHNEFGRRVSQRDNPVFTQGDHATHVIGTIAAAGINPAAKGMSSRVRVDSYDAANDDSELLAAAQSGLLVSSHSYGVLSGWDGGTWYGDAAISPNEDWKFGFYTAETRIWDQIVFNHPQLLICKSAGNDRGDSGPGRPSDGPYDCVSDVATAKNILTVGAVSGLSSRYVGPADVRMSDFSSWGPTDDGRIKPDIVAMGVNVFSTFSQNNGYGTLQGTSMSTPNVSGSLILLQQLYHRLHGRYMNAATLKGLVIHTAHEAGTGHGPDYQFGWGLANMEGAARFLKGVDSVNVILQTRSLEEGKTVRVPLRATSGQRVRVTVIWTDPAGEVFPASLDPTDVKLVNDLNLVVQDQSGNVFLPWVLDPSNPSRAATRGVNSRDNVEMIDFTAATTGIHHVTVSHQGMLRNQRQDFTLLVTNLDRQKRTTSLRWRTGSPSADFNNPSNWTDVESGAISSRPPDQDSFVSVELPTDLALTGGTIQCRGLFVAGNGVLRIQSDDTVRVAEDIVVRSGHVEFAAPHVKLGGRSVSSLVEGSLQTTKGMTFWNGRWRLNDVSILSDSIFTVRASIRLNRSTWRVGFFQSDGRSDFRADRSTLVSRGDILFDGSVEEGADFSIRIDRSDAFARLSAQTTRLVLDSLEVRGKVNVDAAVQATSLLTSGEVNVLRDVLTQDLTLGVSSKFNLGSRKVEIRGNLNATGSPSQRVMLTGSNGRFTSPRNTKYCLDYLEIDGVGAEGQAIFNAGSNSIVRSSPGWLNRACEEVLFADIEVKYPCPNGLTSLESRSSGSPKSFAWQLTPTGAVFDKPVNYVSLPLGNYAASLTVSKDSETHSNTYPFSIINTGSTLRKPSLRKENDLIRVIGFSPNFVWLRDGEVIEGQTNNILPDTRPGKYNVLVFDNFCRFISDTLEIEAIVTSVEETDLLESRLGVYPNPSTGTFLLVNGAAVSDLVILNTHGVKVEFVSRPRGQDRSIELTGPIPGMYLLTYTTGRVRKKNRFIVK